MQYISASVNVTERAAMMNQHICVKKLLKKPEVEVLQVLGF